MEPFLNSSTASPVRWRLLPRIVVAIGIAAIGVALGPTINQDSVFGLRFARERANVPSNHLFDGSPALLRGRPALARVVGFSDPASVDKNRLMRKRLVDILASAWTRSDLGGIEVWTASTSSTRVP